MPKVKLVWFDSYGDYDYSQVVREMTNGWDDISEEDFIYLRNNMYYIAKHPPYSGYTPVLMVQDTAAIETRITTVKEAIANHKKEMEAEVAKKLALKTKIKAKTVAARKAKYEELKKEFGE